MDDSVSIILPVFNEGKNIKNVVGSIFDYIPNHISDFEVIVINDGSIDNTMGIVEELRALYVNLKILSHDKNKGYGHAIKSGIQSSTKKWVFIMDSDGQYQINDFKAFWIKKKDYDFILGFRVKRRDNLYRTFLGGSGNLIASLFFKKRIIDTNCGFKLFKREDLVNLHLYSTGNAIYFEILYKLFKNNTNKLLQCPVNHYPRKHGRQTGGSIRTIITLLFEGARILVKWGQEW